MDNGFIFTFSIPLKILYASIISPYGYRFFKAEVA